MLRAAFGIKMIDGIAQFRDPGQTWIEGSASSLVSVMSPPQEFLQRFPVLQIATNERPFPLWPNSQGVIYLCFAPRTSDGESTPAFWDIVHVFQPKFSRQRSQPLHLFLRIADDYFRKNMALPSAIAALDAARALCDSSPVGGAAWTLAHSAALSPQSPESLDDLRMAAAIFGRASAGEDPILAPLDSIVFWRGLQVFMQGIADAGVKVQVAILLEDQASIPLVRDQKHPLTIGSYSSGGGATAPPPLNFHGVSDEALLAEGISPTKIVQDALTESSNGAKGTFEELYSPPIRLKPLSHVSDKELSTWAHAVGENETRTRDEIRKLVGQFSQSGPTQKQLKQLAHILVAAKDVAEGAVDVARRRLQEMLEFGA